MLRGGQGLAEKGKQTIETKASVGFDGDGVKVTWLLQHIAECCARRPEYKVVVTSHAPTCSKSLSGRCGLERVAFPSTLLHSEASEA